MIPRHATETILCGGSVSIPERPATYNRTSTEGHERKESAFIRCFVLLGLTGDRERDRERQTDRERQRERDREKAVDTSKVKV